MSTPPAGGLARLLELVAREDRHLREVRDRLFGGKTSTSGAWVARLVATPEGVDRLESFGAKVARLQDTLVHKLLPEILRSAGEPTGAAIDNLNRAERLGLLAGVDAWLAARRLRNRLVHEYVGDPAELASALAEAYAFTDTLHAAHVALARYAREHLGITT